MNSGSRNLNYRRDFLDALFALTNRPWRSLGRLLVLLIGFELLLIAMYFAVTTFLVDYAAQAQDGHIGGFDLDDEATLAVWFSSLQLLVVGFVCFLLSWTDEITILRLKSSTMWKYVGAVMFIMSVDEVAGLHEVVGLTMAELLPQVPIDVSLWWSIPYALVLAPVFGFAVARLVGKPSLAIATLCSGLLWVAANSLERVFLFSGPVNVALEECFEMLGATLLLGVFATHLLQLRASRTSAQSALSSGSAEIL